MKNKKDALLEVVIDSAQRHGADSEPDHEVGDLQDALRLAWAKLTEAQANEVYDAIEIWE